MIITIIYSQSQIKFIDQGEWISPIPEFSTNFHEQFPWTHMHTHSFLVTGRLRWKFRDVLEGILEVRLFYMKWNSETKPVGW